MKMYILVRNCIPTGHAATAIAHAAAAACLKWPGDERFDEWRENSFKKVVCMVTDKEFERAEECKDCIVMTESALDDEKTALVLKPRPIGEWPKMIKYLRLYR